MNSTATSETYSFDTFRWELVRDRPLFTRVAQCRQPTDAVRLAYDVIGTRDREHFIAILLNTRNKVITIDTVSIGTLNGSLVHPREVFRLAIVKGAAGIITAHNHPSGDATPSREDLDLVQRLTEAGKVLGIGQLDHVIVTPEPGCWTSFKEKGLL